MDTRGHLHNKVAAVVAGRCAVTELRLAFAALCAQGAVLPGGHADTLLGLRAASLLGSTHGMPCNAYALATLPCCQVAKQLGI